MTQPAAHPVVLFCKSYEGDLRRVKRLVDSIAKHNRDAIPLYISVPSKDRGLFERSVSLPPSALARGDHLVWLSDEDIIAAQPQPEKALGHYRDWDGRLSQQVVKSEFWRLGLCDNYVCMDSDSVFIRDFGNDTFLDPDTGHAYTVIYQSKEMLQLAENRRITKVLEHFLKDSAQGKALLGRRGPDYDFSPTPVIWSAHVWRDLYDQYLLPRGMDLWDAIENFPSELRWYGEALLHFKSIPLLPIEPLFRVYHYDWQYLRMKKLGETPETVKALYWGLVLQSNWDFDMDYGAQAKRKSALSRFARRIKRSLAQYR